MQGEINVVSRFGEGTSFWFTFFCKQIKIDRKKLEKIENPVIEVEEKLNARILLVEDNKVNQQVASLMLQRMGCEVTVAGNGMEALTSFVENEFDLIFMDVQMPGMDGVEATQQLKKQFKKLPPIIGLSANALEGDAEKFIKLGMDDYLSKPFTYQSLYQKLIQKIKVEQKPDGKDNSAFNQEILKIKALPPVNFKVLDELKALSGGNIDFIRELWDNFCNDCKDLHNQIEWLRTKEEWQELIKPLHTMKGLCGTIGASQMFELCKTINLKLKSNQLAEIDVFLDLLKYFIEDLDKLVERLNF